jgi:hypothetical protein
MPAYEAAQSKPWLVAAPFIVGRRRLSNAPAASPCDDAAGIWPLLIAASSPFIESFELHLIRIKARQKVQAYRYYV